jgi:hypothetical protein
MADHGESMRALTIVAVVILAFRGECLFGSGNAESTKTTVVRGWLSDEQCAKARASEGAYTQTDPDCARKCVKAGKKIVLIDSDEHRVLMIENQRAAVSSLGNYVAIAGLVNRKTQTVYITSVKVLEVNHAFCRRGTNSH